MRLGRRARWIMIGVTMALALTVVASGPVKEALREQVKHVPVPPTLTITPGTNITDVPISTEIGMTVSDGKISAVTLTDGKGNRMDGAMRDDGSAWVPNSALNYKQAYTAQVTATNDAGLTTTRTAAFTTMAEPADQTAVQLNVTGGSTYGVALPITVNFDVAVPEQARGEVQRRLFVSTDPPQPGAWHWVNGKEVYYRAPDYWQPGTKINVRAALGGHPLGDGRYGEADRTATAMIGEKLFLDIDNKTKQMSVFKNDNLVRQIPVSLGKPSTPTSSGKMVIMEKFETTVFDTRGSNDPYVVTVHDAQRLTDGGEFIHSAPWSVGSQGYDNVSHGCTNVSPEDAAFLFSTTNVGDLLTIQNTEVTLDPGNGWTAWNMSWDEYIKGSALPVPADLKPTPAPAPDSAGKANGSPTPTPSTKGR
jgi:lipoprotein-anchoring transpeptidase ErfK/SrfK